MTLPAGSEQDAKQARFYAIRKCTSLTAPAIFASWEDCKSFIDASTTEYKTFHAMNDAVQYILEALAPKSPTPSSQAQVQEAQSSAPFDSHHKAPAPDPSRKLSAKEAVEQSSAPFNSQHKAALPIPSKKQRAKDGEAQPPTHSDFKAAAPSQNARKEDAASQSPSHLKAAPPRKQQEAQTSEPPYSHRIVAAAAAAAPPASRKRPAEEAVAQSSEPKKQRRRGVFEERFEMLKRYKEKYHTLDVSLKHESVTTGEFKGLGHWIGNTRRQIKNYQEDPTTSNLDESQIGRLLVLGFVVKPDVKRRTTKTKHSHSIKREQKSNSRFESMLSQLEEFKKEHGHTNVPPNPRSSLRFWVENIRAEYKKLKSGSPSTLTPARVAKLTQLGFVFVTTHRKSFDERALEWFEFRTKHGREPKSEYCGLEEYQLAYWAMKFRRKANKFFRGEPSPGVKQEQIDKMKEWGFNFDLKMAPVAPKTAIKSWDERYQELVEYKEKHGNTLVPQSVQGLGGWVKRQRKEYQKMKRNLKYSLSKEKIARLKAIGFKFSVRSTAGRPRSTGAQVPSEEEDGDDDDDDEEEEEEEESENDVEPQNGRYASGGHAAPIPYNPSNWAGNVARMPDGASAPWSRYRTGRMGDYHGTI